MKKHFNHDEHRHGVCEGELCIGWYRTEMTLGLPDPTAERDAYYDRQRMAYAPWLKASFCPDWTLAEGVCRNCKAETLVIRAGKMNLCVMWCLNTAVPFYPTGMNHPTAQDFLKHAKDCKKANASTLHSWSLTSRYSDALKTAFMFSSPKTMKTTSSSTSSSSERTKLMKKSSSHSHLPNLVLSNHLLPSSNTQRK